LRPVMRQNALRFEAGTPLGDLTTLPRPLAGFGEGNREGKWKGLGRIRERWEKERKERER